MAITTLLYIAALAAAALAWTTPPTATVINGTYQGINADEFGQQFFLGMPFAQQPVGDLRLRAPLSLNESWTGTRSASNYSAICPGFPIASGADDDKGYELSEACLTANIIRPNTVSASSSGGGFSMGGSADHRYNGSWIVQRSMEMGSPIIFASFNYRVHAFGFLGGAEVHAAGLENLGLFDQRLALQWIQENVATFGGDPTKVTVMGESAGAMSIANHLTAYGGRNDGLFRGAIMESGSPTTENYARIQQLEPFYQSVLVKARCANATDTLNCLRGVLYDTYRAATNGTNWQPVIDANGSHQWQPIIDGDFLPEYPTEMLQQGEYVKVPLLMGSNTDEGTSFAVYGIENTEQLAAAMSTNYPRLSNASIERVIDLYPNDPAIGCPYGSGDGLLPSGYLDKQSAAIFGDMLMVSGMYGVCGANRELSDTQPVWKYRFNQVPINYTMTPSSVMHYVEVAYVYSNQLAVDVNPLGTRPNDLSLANLMTSMWISFVNNLDPNYSQVEGAPFWPSYSSSPKNLVFQNNWLGSSYVEFDNWRQEGIAFINSLGADMQH
ncbi:alpha/beta-hydrolase [Dacryopinax primogenitus]|uniref:Carboxylic ester hydrolase n=1 Tax=Dacryopinax primogenitus (strain DJM 731) TaxID=1858805 RepID=M5FR12_DACPD|nr:alpha/beta-hydrolase [Dacryopinax primogenitus]EJT98043.1 alpha/beta-hydrolase [Dacryopinax primogenitus]